jgi:nicotinate-nucleotide pyrophosphorylase (carboxylating)
VLVKENHLDAWKGRLAPADFAYRILAARRAGLTTIIEARNKGEILGALEAGADVLLLDNFSTARLRPIVRWIGSVCRKRGLRRPLLEVSGGVNLRTVGRITRAGVDRISVGGITHSAPALDMSLDIRG